MADEPAAASPPQEVAGDSHTDEAAELPGQIRRWLPRLGVVALALAASALVWSCFGHGDRSSYAAPVARLASASAGVTYLPRGRLYIVAQPDGSLLALDEALPDPPAGRHGCAVQWRPDVSGGVFQARPGCGDASYARDGASRSAGAPLLRHPLKLAGKNAVVDIRQCAAEAGGPARPCTALRPRA